MCGATILAACTIRTFFHHVTPSMHPPPSPFTVYPPPSHHCFCPPEPLADATLVSIETLPSLMLDCFGPAHVMLCKINLPAHWDALMSGSLELALHIPQTCHLVIIASVLSRSMCVDAWSLCCWCTAAGDLLDCVRRKPGAGSAGSAAPQPDPCQPLSHH